MVRHLKETGVKILQVRENTYSVGVYFNDPDRNGLEVYHEEPGGFRRAWEGQCQEAVGVKWWPSQSRLSQMPAVSMPDDGDLIGEMACKDPAARGPGEGDGQQRQQGPDPVQALDARGEGHMKQGYKVIDMDTHVGPSFDVLCEYVEPGFRPRLQELEQYRQKGGKNIAVAPYQWTRYAGQKPHEKPAILPGGQTGWSRQSRSSRGYHRAPPRPGIDEQDAHARLLDMDREGRDIDLIFPGNWAPPLASLDISIQRGLYRAFHRYIREYCSADPTRLKSIALLPGVDIAWSIAELKGMLEEKWLAAVWLMLPEGMPIDDPDLDPLYEVLNESHLPLVEHSFTSEPPFWPGYRDVWDNPVMVRTASHPWRAARWLTYLIIGRIFDRFPHLNAAVAEVGHGWLPHWVKRLDAMIEYVASDTVPPLQYKAVEYVQMGRFLCPCEHFEGMEMTKACYELLGDNCWAFQSDYPHPEACFPDTAELIIDWPIWQELGDEALHKHMHGNAERILRLL